MWTDLEVINGPKGSKEEMSSKKSDITPKKPKKRCYSKWIIFILIAIVISLGLIWCFNRGSHQTKAGDSLIVDQSFEEDEIIINSKGIKILDVGVYNFEMNAGEETGWIQLPTSKRTFYLIHSSKDNWIIEFSDGSIFTSWGPETSFPHKDFVRFKIKSPIKQSVTITVSTR